MTTKLNIKLLTREAKEIRKLILSMIVAAHASHIASSYSIVELLVYLYFYVLNINKDRFILSKGWGVSALYATMYRKGIIARTLLDEFCKNGSKMIGAATRNGLPYIETTTGSMGHGLPIGVGMAKAMKIQHIKNRVFIIISDGELDEGSTWEGILLAAHHKLDNLIIMVDYNKWQSFGRTNKVLNLEPLKKKFLAFNWYVQEAEGHNFVSINNALQNCLKNKDKPSVVIAHTVKGKGLSVIEDKNEWHYQTPREYELKIAKKEGLL